MGKIRTQSFVASLGADGCLGVHFPCEAARHSRHQERFDDRGFGVKPMQVKVINPSSR